MREVARTGTVRASPVKSIEAETLDLGAYDEVIDVRTPSEFADDRIPGACNLPVLTDAQRAEVGTLYKKATFEARRLGAGYIAGHVASHVLGHFGDKPRSYAPLIYCWRGGQRSNAMAHVLERIGYTVHVLARGYKSFRTRVRADLRTLPKPLSFRVLAGFTGCGKTKILQALAARGAQVLDLEGLANHQGSLLGEPPGGQNMSQKRFESRLWDALRRFDPAQPVWTEAESATIGGVELPKEVLYAVRGGQVVEVEASRDERSRFLAADYAWWRDNPDVLLNKLRRLVARHGHAELDLWQSHAHAGNWPAFVDRLLSTHYDPAYARSRGKNYAAPTHRLQVSRLLEDGPARAAEQLLRGVYRT